MVFHPRGVTCTSPSLPSRVLFDRHECWKNRTEPGTKRGHVVTRQICSSLRQPLRSPRFADRMGKEGGGREDYFSFCRIGPTKCVSRYRKRKKERERRENHRSWCNFGVWYMVHLKSMNFLSFMMDRDSLMGSLSRYFPILCWKFNLRRLGQRIIVVWNFFRYSRLDFG